MKLKDTKAFSLHELLIVIAVIGIITAIALPAFSNIQDGAEIGKDRRNAQNLASIYQTGAAAGLDFNGDSLRATIDNIIVGSTVTTPGVFESTYFGVPGMSATDADAASRYLLWDGQDLRYLPDSE